MPWGTDEENLGAERAQRNCCPHLTALKPLAQGCLTGARALNRDLMQVLGEANVIGVVRLATCRVPSHPKPGCSLPDPRLFYQES